MTIAVPSKNRAFKTKTDKVFAGAVFYVPAGEAEDYRKYIENVVPVPADVKGITKTRNWILRNTDDMEIVFLDDDVKVHGYYDQQGDKAFKREIEPSVWIEEFRKFFDLTEQLGYKIWGVKTESQLKSSYPMNPFLFQTYVTASCMGIINDGSYYFDESFPVKEDYEICLRHIMDKGGILGARYLFWENDHWADDGGCKDYRTQQMEEDAIKRLTKMYPGYIRKAERKGSDYSIQLEF